MTKGTEALANFHVVQDTAILHNLLQQEDGFVVSLYRLTIRSLDDED